MTRSAKFDFSQVTRYLSTDAAGRPHLDSGKIAHAARFDDKFVVITNDDTLSTEDVALGYKGGTIIEACFRRMKQTGLEVRPMYHWSPRRIEAHVRLCVLALQIQRSAELRCGLPWARIAHILAGLRAVRYQIAGRTIVQRTKISPEAAEILKNQGRRPQRSPRIRIENPSPNSRYFLTCAP